MYMYVPSSELLVKSSGDEWVAITTVDCVVVPDEKVVKESEWY